jgi:hypothetical protein
MSTGTTTGSRAASANEAGDLRNRGQRLFPAQSITVPYKPDFDRFKEHASGVYHGASLTALAELCRAHGIAWW